MVKRQEIWAWQFPAYWRDCSAKSRCGFWWVSPDLLKLKTWKIPSNFPSISLLRKFVQVALCLFFYYFVDLFRLSHFFIFLWRVALVSSNESHRQVFKVTLICCFESSRFCWKIGKNPRVSWKFGQFYVRGKLGNSFMWSHVQKWFLQDFRWHIWDTNSRTIETPKRSKLVTRDWVTEK